MPSEGAIGEGRREATSRRWLFVGLAVLVYILVVMIVDTLALRRVEFIIDWSAFRWRFENGFDLYKFVLWFVVPMAALARWMDWGYFGVKRWRKMDAAILGGLALIGLAAVLLTRYVPALAHMYPGMSHLPAEWKWHEAQWRLIWTFSWLVGWEFLFRYALVSPFERAGMPWLTLVSAPLVEGVYHLIQKPQGWLEALGMVFYSLILCTWAVKRRNALLPFLAHGIIELELLALQLLA